MTAHIKKQPATGWILDEIELEFGDNIVSHPYNDYWEFFKIDLKSKTFIVENAHPIEDLHTVIAKPEKEALEAKLSQDFLEYHRKYYTSFKNSLDLIGSNFKLIYDGYSSSYLIDDLIVWTNEFNELLGVYEHYVKPINKMDKELFLFTNEIIINQREANKSIIEGLENSDNQAFFTAGEYLNLVVDLYLEGDALIK